MSEGTVNKIVIPVNKDEEAATAQAAADKIVADKLKANAAASGGDGGDGSGGSGDGEGDDETSIMIDDTKYQLNDKGDAVGSDGQVFKTKAELDELEGEGKGNEGDVTNTVEVDNDGVVTTYTVDDNGNAVDDKGEIVYTKEQLDEGDDTPPAGDIDVQAVVDSTKIPIYDQEGNAVEFDNTPEGLNNYVEAVYQRASNESVQQAFNSLYTQYPFLNNMLNHIDAGGVVEDFKQETDYAKIKLDKTNEKQLRAIAIEGYMSKGMDAEKANNYFDYIKSTGTDNDEIFTEATNELKYLNDNKVARDTAKTQEQENTNRQQQLDTDNYWGVSIDEQGQLVNLNKENSVYSIINSGTINVDTDTFTIPEKIKVIENGKPKLYSRGDFFAYLRQPITVLDENGNRVTTTRDNVKIQEANAKRTNHNSVLEAYKRFTNNDISQLINEKVKNKEVKKIRQIKLNNINKNNRGSGTSKQGATKGKRIVINTNG